MDAKTRTLRAAAVCGIVIQLGWLIWSFGMKTEIPWGWAIGIAIGLSTVPAALVHASQRSERRWFYATAIVSSSVTWSVLWGLVGFVAAQLLAAPIFATAGFVFGALAGSVFGCLIALRARVAPVGIVELVILGAIAGVLLGLAGGLEEVLEGGSAENWVSVALVLAILGGLGGVACNWVVSRAARTASP